MRFSLCKPASLCPTLGSERRRRKKRKKRRRKKQKGGGSSGGGGDGSKSSSSEASSDNGRPDFNRPSSLLRQLDEEDGTGSWRLRSARMAAASGRLRRGSGGRRICHGSSAASAATVASAALIYRDPESLPSIHEALASFMEIYPRYAETAALDEFREREYGHLRETRRVCLDYCGFGLFSYLQQLENWESSSFALEEISVNLCSHALFGAAEAGTVECDLRTRIMVYLGVSAADYSMVFTASRGATFRLLADAYPFEAFRRLLTMYDYESESAGWMRQRALEKGARATSARFKWPSLRLCSTDLKRQIIAGSNSGLRRRSKEPVKGLFVFPVQSRVSGAKYSYQWMSLAQQSHWHVLLDASALGPKDMASLGLSLFRPDFIIASFYKVFGADPSGFGCLFIKNSVIRSIQDSTGAPAPGIVTVVPFPIQWRISGEASEDLLMQEERDEGESNNTLTNSESQKGNYLMSMESSFSGPMLGLSRDGTLDGSRHPLHSFMEDVIEEGNEDEEDDFALGKKVGRSPVFREDVSDNPFSVEICVSPTQSTSDEGFSGGPFFGPAGYGYSSSMSAEITRNFSPVNNHNHYQDEGPSSHSHALPYNGESESDDILSFSDAYSEMSDASGCKYKEEERGPAEMEPRSQQGTEVGEGIVANNGKGGAVKEHGIRRASLNQHDSEITEIGMEAENSKVAISESSRQRHLQGDDGGRAIQRETEGNFRLLGRRNGSDPFSLGRKIHVNVNANDPEDYSLSQPSDEDEPALKEEERPVEESLFEGASSSMFSVDPDIAEFGSEPEEADGEREPEVFCGGLDLADAMGLNKSNRRLRCLINWLVGALLQLRHPGPERDLALVHIYGPRIRFDRGASVAFNLFDCHGRMLHPELVRALADKNDISISVGYLQSLQFSESRVDLQYFDTEKEQINKGAGGVGTGVGAGKRSGGRELPPMRIEAATAALSLLSNFEDVYRLWVFVARFLDADFASREAGDTINP